MLTPDERSKFEKVSIGSVAEVYEVEEATEENRYTVWLVNTTDWVFYEIETQSGTRTPLPTSIGKNCPSGDCDTCWEQAKADPVASSVCTELPYTIKLRGKKGGTIGLLEIPVSPTCDSPGVWVCLS